MLTLDFDRQCLTIGQVQHSDTTGWDEGLWLAPAAAQADQFRDLCRHELVQGRHYRLRVLMRAEHYEIYLDDRWIFTTVFTTSPRQGALEGFVRKGTVRFSGLEIKVFPPLD